MSDEQVTLDADAPLAPGWIPPEIDTTRAHPARIYDAMIGGKDHFEVDRRAAEVARQHIPQAWGMAQANRAFLGRAVRFLAEAGVTQFLDIGTGIPGPGNTGEVARHVHPGARVVYVDYDPIVAVHTRALLAGADPASTAVVLADAREPETILEHPQVRAVLDFERPVAVLMVALLHFVAPEHDVPGLVARYLDAVCPGSALVLTHITEGRDPEAGAAARKGWEQARSQLHQRTAEEVRELFAGTEIVEPGVVQLQQWRPDDAVDPDFEVWIHGGVGYKR
ncbi:SAM-dependent methyltransferase [Catenulispora subtropica]|uniref:SAM-dependent methyltransferase n=1 Tax=Catenulispora subtropica TaxID=450798 RepID=UPI0031DAF780